MRGEGRDAITDHVTRSKLEAGLGMAGHRALLEATITTTAPILDVDTFIRVE